MACFYLYSVHVYVCLRTISLWNFKLSDFLLYLQPCIIKIEDVVDTPDVLYIILEL